MTEKTDIAAIVLAAGIGKRMKSSYPKVLHLLGNEPMIVKTLNLLETLDISQKIIVVGFQAELVKKALLKRTVDFALQKQQLGTANALQAGLVLVKKEIEHVIVLNGDDSAFYKNETLKKIISNHINHKNVLTFATTEAKNPRGLGRVIRKNNKPVAIVEEKEADEKQKKIKEINCGLYVFQKDWLKNNIKTVRKSQASGEYYIVDLISKSIEKNQKIEAFKIVDPDEWFGINSPQQLKKANRIIKTQKEKIHFMGLAGAGESAVAALAKNYSYQISGCDIEPNSSYIQNLGLKILKGHNKNHLKNIKMLVISPAVQKLNNKNEEIIFARKNKIPVLTWQEFQGKFLQRNKFVIAVAGGYGKSTTTAMISKILEDAKLDPTCVIGAKLIDWQSNFRFGNSTYYVCEADEYNNNFLYYQPNIAIILNISWDHPDFFKSKKDVENSYKKFINNIKPQGILVIPENNNLNNLVKSCRKDIKIIKVKDFGDYKLSIIGAFRCENADAALTIAQILKISAEKAKVSVQNFKGLERRLELKGSVKNCQVYDDYAVQPYTVLKTARALKEKYPHSKFVLVFEPHTFSRVKTFFREFINSLKQIEAESILITDVFAARETGNTVKLSKDLAAAVGYGAKYSGSIEKTAKYLNENIGNFDLILTMGAGNVYKLYDLIKT